MKDNKLIAEFMGYDISTIASNGIEVVEFENNDVKVENLRYHTSWDWLMPVLKKIKLQVHPDTVGMWRKVTQPIGYDTHEVHEEAVEFIKRYGNE